MHYPAHPSGYDAHIPDSPPMDVNLYSTVIVNIVAVLLVLWLSHACTFLPLMVPFAPQVAVIQIL